MNRVQEILLIYSVRSVFKYQFESKPNFVHSLMDDVAHSATEENKKNDSFCEKYRFA